MTDEHNVWADPVASAGLMPTEARGNYFPEPPHLGLRETKTYHSQPLESTRHARNYFVPLSIRPIFIFCCRSYVKLLDYWRAEIFFSTSGAPLRPEACGICHICHMVNPALTGVLSAREHISRTACSIIINVCASQFTVAFSVLLCKSTVARFSSGGVAIRYNTSGSTDVVMYAHNGNEQATRKKRIGLLKSDSTGDSIIMDLTQQHILKLTHQGQHRLPCFDSNECGRHPYSLECPRTPYWSILYLLFTNKVA